MIRTASTLIALLAAGAIFFAYTKPAYDSVQSLRSQVAAYSSALDKAAELKKIKEDLLSRYNSFDPGALERLHKLLPDHVDNVALILDLDSIAGRYGMGLENVDVSAPASDEAGSAAIGLVGAAGRHHDSVTINFSTSGTYDHFLQFLRSLETSLRVVDLVSLELAPQAIAGGVSAVPIYHYDVSLRTYWLK